MRCACFRRKLALFTNFSRLFRHYALEKSFKTCIIAFCARCARLGPGTDFDFQKGIYNYETVHQDRCCLRPGCQPGRLRQLRFFYRRFFCCLFRGCFQRCCFFCGCQRGRFFRGCFQRSRSLQRRSTVTGRPDRSTHKINEAPAFSPGTTPRWKAGAFLLLPVRSVIAWGRGIAFCKRCRLKEAVLHRINLTECIDNLPPRYN